MDSPTEPQVPVTVEVLRYYRIPLDVKDITAQCAKRMGCAQYYENVDAILRSQEKLGRVEVVTERDDYRFTTWRAT